MQNTTVFLYISNEHEETKIKHIIPFAYTPFTQIKKRIFRYKFNKTCIGLALKTTKHIKEKIKI